MSENILLIAEAEAGAQRILARIASGELLAYAAYDVGASAPPQIGDVYLVRLGEYAPPHQAYFVELGGGAAGLLEATALPGFAQWVGHEKSANTGAFLLASVTNTALQTKYPRLSAKITLSSPLLSISLTTEAAAAGSIEISRRIKEGREEMRQAIASRLAPRHDLRVRSAAAGLSVAVGLEQVTASYHALTKLAETLAAAALARQKDKKLGRIYGNSARLAHFIEHFITEAAQTAQPARPFKIIVQNGALLTEIKAKYQDFAAQLGVAEKLRFQAAPLGFDLLAQHHVRESQLAALDARHETDKNAILWLDERPMAALFDIDRGGNKETALAVNLAMLPIIRRLVAVRNVSGLILIDFLRMKKPSERALLDTELRRHPPWGKIWDCHGFTRTGLYEITLPRSQG